MDQGGWGVTQSEVGVKLWRVKRILRGVTGREVQVRT